MENELQAIRNRERIRGSRIGDCVRHIQRCGALRNYEEWLEQLENSSNTRSIYPQAAAYLEILMGKRT